MISEWLYGITRDMGGSFNNAAGIERSPQSDVLSGVTSLWAMLLCVTLIAVCFIVLYVLERKEEKK